MAVQRRWILSLLPLLFMGRASAGATTSVAMGFHEGARRTVKCDGGFITGLDVFMGRTMGFAEETLVALRLKCSSGKIKVEYLGSTSDNHIFGSLESPTMQPMTVDCPSGTGVAAIDWRRASSSDKEHTARIGGLRVHCNTEMNPQPVVVDKVGPGMDYPVSLRCSEANTPLKGDKVRLTAVEVWFEQMFSGLHMLECGLAQQ